MVSTKIAQVKHLNCKRLGFPCFCFSPACFSSEQLCKAIFYKVLPLAAIVCARSRRLCETSPPLFASSIACLLSALVPFPGDRGAKALLQQKKRAEACFGQVLLAFVVCTLNVFRLIIFMFWCSWMLWEGVFAIGFHENNTGEHLDSSSRCFSLVPHPAVFYQACVCVAQAHLGKKKRAEACCGQFYLRCLQLVWVQRSFCCCFPQLEALGLSTDDFLAGCTMDDIELLEEGLVPCKLVKRWSECSCAWDFQNCSAMETPDTRGFQRGPWSAFWFELFTKPGCFERRR